MKRGSIRLSIVLLGISLLGLVACVHYQPELLDPAATAQQLTQRSLTDPGLEAFIEQTAQQPPVDWPLSTWGLTNLSLAAFYFHPDLDAARATWAEAQAAERSARQRPDPSLAMGPGFNTTTSTPSPWILTSVLGLTVETAGKRDARKESASQLAEAARLHLAATAWQVRSQVRENLAALYTARETRRLLELQQEIQEENVRRTEQLFAAGAVSAYERTQARIAAEQSLLALRDAERQAAEAQVQLAAAIGVMPEALEGVPLSFDELNTVPPEITLPEARTQALMNRIDLLEALAEYAAREADLRLEIARQYPDLDLGPGFEFDQGDNKWSLDLSISLPFFNMNRGPIAQAQAQRTEAAARFEALQLRVVESVARAVTAYQASLNKLAEAEALQAGAQAQVQRTEALIGAGQLSGADLVAVRLYMSEASLAYLSVLSEVQEAHGVLEDALQSPLDLPSAVWENAPRTSSTSNNQ